MFFRKTLRACGIIIPLFGLQWILTIYRWMLVVRFPFEIFAIISQMLSYLDFTSACHNKIACIDVKQIFQCFFCFGTHGKVKLLFFFRKSSCTQFYFLWDGNHGYIIDGYIIVKVWCNFFAGVLCSTLDIGPWNLQFVFGFRKVNRCQSIRKHCKSLKLGKI